MMQFYKDRQELAARENSAYLEGVNILITDWYFWVLETFSVLTSRPTLKRF